MTDRAIVIGIDAYPGRPGWELRAAVRDAELFADWVTAPGAGRASNETLTLLLAPHPERPARRKDFTEPTEEAIEEALFQALSIPDGISRLWFFYAGHGVAAPGSGADAAPAVIPTGHSNYARYLTKPIELAPWIREMQIRNPLEQLYFVDACRGIVVSDDPVTRFTSLHFDLSKARPGKAGEKVKQSSQAILYATTAGELANELKLHGLFGGALLDALNGHGPELAPRPLQKEFALTWGALVAYAQRRIQLKGEELERQNRTMPTQRPGSSVFLASDSLEITRFAKKPGSPIQVYVEPEHAKSSGTAGIRTYNEWKNDFERQAEKPSPLEEPVTWLLPSGFHVIEIEAKGFRNWEKEIQVIGPGVVTAALEPVPEVDTLAEGGLESYDPDGGLDVLPPDGAQLAAGAFGQIDVVTKDRYARIELFDRTGKRIEAAWQRLAKSVPVGEYRIEVSLPTEPTVTRSLLVTTKPIDPIRIEPMTQLTQTLAPVLGPMGMNPDLGVTEPSEAFGPSTTTHLGSILAWAAWASRFRPDQNGHKLRQIGIDRLAGADPTQSYVQVLVGDARPVGDNPQGGPIETLQLAATSNGVDQAVVVEPVPALQNFAVQWQAPATYQTSVTLQTGGLSPKRFPVSFIPGYVSVIMVVREASGRTEVHRYLNPIDPSAVGHGWFNDCIRRIEQNWRALEARTPLHENEPAELEALHLDPLSLAVLGYRLLREQRLEELKPLADRIIQAGLTDGHVLAAAIADRDDHMRSAISSPVPLVGEGYHLMAEWLEEQFATAGLPPPVPAEPFTGGLWTTFDPRAAATISRAFAVTAAPAWAKPLLSVAAATARIEPTAGGAYSFVGTGFLVGECALALASFTLPASSPAAGHSAVFGDGIRATIEDVVARSSDELHTAVARIAAVPAAPVAIRWALPRIGQRIAVIGHPTLNVQNPTVVTMAAFTTPPAGEKMIMPGVITAVEETRLTYECWTMAGVAGGPIVDLETGEVIGIHHSGRYDPPTAKKLGFGVPVTAIESLLKTPPTRG